MADERQDKAGATASAGTDPKKEKPGSVTPGGLPTAGTDPIRPPQHGTIGPGPKQS
jgi:hypothetical protein